MGSLPSRIFPGGPCQPPPFVLPDNARWERDGAETFLEFHHSFMTAAGIEIIPAISFPDGIPNGGMLKQLRRAQMKELLARGSMPIYHVPVVGKTESARDHPRLFLCHPQFDVFRFQGEHGFEKRPFVAAGHAGSPAPDRILVAGEIFPPFIHCRGRFDADIEMKRLIDRRTMAFCPLLQNEFKTLFQMDDLGEILLGGANGKRWAVGCERIDPPEEIGNLRAGYTRESGTRAVRSGHPR